MSNARPVLGIVLLTALVAGGLPVGLADAADPPPGQPAGRFRVGDTFEQDVTVTRRSAFRVLGTEVSQGAQYSLGSTIAVVKANPDGTVVARQTIKTTKLVDADRDFAPSLAAALEKAKGTTFDLTVGPAGEVTALTGLKDPVQVLAGKDAALGQTLHLWSILDADAWKELAGLTFFVPEAKATWDRRIEHDWGALGTWRGKTAYAADRRDPKRFDYRHELYHRAPAAGADKGLPVRVLKAEFKPPESRGTIVYDPAAKRVASAEEAFRVYGAVTAAAGGSDVTVELIEEQGFRLAVRQPTTTRDLVGGRK